MVKYYNLIISILVLLYILYNQIRTRQVHKHMKLTFPIILVILGLSRFKSYFNAHPLTVITLVSIVASFSILAVGMGAIRAYTVKLWANDNVIFRKGTWLTIVLWIISIFLHLVIDEIGHTGQSTLLIYYGITLSVQRWVIQSRVRHIFPNIKNNS